MRITEDTDEDRKLTLQLDILGPETYSDGSYEGWIKYHLALIRGEWEIVSTTAMATMLDEDVQSIVDVCSNSPRIERTIEPLEPDFRLTIEPLEDDGVRITCFIDDMAASTGIYGDGGVGITFVTTRSQIKQFGEQCKAELDAITLEKIT